MSITPLEKREERLMGGVVLTEVTLRSVKSTTLCLEAGLLMEEVLTLEI